MRTQIIDDNTRFVLPVWPLITGVVSFMGCVVALTWWVSVTFFTKEEARALEVRTDQKVIGVQNQVDRISGTVEQVARDTAFIRGKLEGKP